MPKKKANSAPKAAPGGLKIKVLRGPVRLGGITYGEGEELECAKAFAESLIERHYAELATGKAQPAPVLEEVEGPEGDE